MSKYEKVSTFENGLDEALLAVALADINARLIKLEAAAQNPKIAPQQVVNAFLSRHGIDPARKLPQREPGLYPVRIGELPTIELRVWTGEQWNDQDGKKKCSWWQEPAYSWIGPRIQPPEEAPADESGLIQHPPYDHPGDVA